MATNSIATNSMTANGMATNGMATSEEVFLVGPQTVWPQLSF